MPLTLTKPLLTTTLAGCVNVNTVNAADDEVDPVAILVPADGLSSARDRGEGLPLCSSFLFGARPAPPGHVPAPMEQAFDQGASDQPRATRDECLLACAHRSRE